jgi:hypothetical protein
MPIKIIWSSPCLASQARRPPQAAAPLLIPSRAGLANPLAWFSLFFVRADNLQRMLFFVGSCHLPSHRSVFGVQCSAFGAPLTSHLLLLRSHRSGIATPWIGVGTTVRSPLPPNRTGGSPASGSPVGG